MREKSDSTPQQGRRKFLKSAVAAGGATAAGAVIANNALVSTEPDQAEEKEKGQSSKGYRETEHVRDYYRSARV